MSKEDSVDQSDKTGLEFNRLEYLGIAAGLFAFVGGLEQLFHTYNKKKVDDIWERSKLEHLRYYFMYSRYGIFTFTNTCLCCVHGFMIM